ncbi:MAG: DNA recombination/repair protein RecA, partial [Candidatus Pacebacteria bacterium]|nr:DNA recombination/repair protein RecA [Candidatus Paceibacterota bacterium]
KAKVVKNKVAAPFKTAEFDIYYNEGISKVAEILNLGTKEGVIKKSGSHLQYGEVKLGAGVEKAKEFLKENPKVFKEIKEEILKKQS